VQCERSIRFCPVYKSVSLLHSRCRACLPTLPTYKRVARFSLSLSLTIARLPTYSPTVRLAHSRTVRLLLRSPALAIHPPPRQPPDPVLRTRSIRHIVLSISKTRKYRFYCWPRLPCQPLTITYTNLRLLSFSNALASGREALL
jgi:hypothetical protein